MFVFQTSTKVKTVKKVLSLFQLSRETLQKQTVLVAAVVSTMEYAKIKNRLINLGNVNPEARLPLPNFSAHPFPIFGRLQSSRDGSHLMGTGVDPTHNVNNLRSASCSRDILGGYKVTV